MVIVSADQIRKSQQLAFPRDLPDAAGTDMAALPAADLFLPLRSFHRGQPWWVFRSCFTASDSAMLLGPSGGQS